MRPFWQGLPVLWTPSAAAVIPTHQALLKTLLCPGTFCHTEMGDLWSWRSLTLCTTICFTLEMKKHCP